MRVVAAVVGLVVLTSALADYHEERAKIYKKDDKKDYHEALNRATPEQKKAIEKFLAERARSRKETEEEEEKRDGTVIRWHSMSEVRRLQNEGRKLVIARIEPIDAAGFERRLEVVAAELRAKGAEEAIWIKRVVLADDDPVWLGWEGIPLTTELFLLTGDPKERAKIYQGSDTFTDLLTWLLEYLPPLRPREIATEKEMDEFMLASPVSVIAYVPRELGADGSFQEFVRKIARRHPYLPVGLVYPAEELPYKKHALAPIVIYYRDEDHVFPLDEDRLREMDDFTRDNALKKASHQFLSRFPDDAAHIFSQGIDKIVFVFDAVGERRGQTPSYLRELALEMRQRVVIAYVDAKDERMDGVRQFFGVESSTVRGFDAKTERQFWPARPLSGLPLLPYEVETFVRDLSANKLEPHSKVERIDEEVNREAAAVKLNTVTFDETALSPSVDAVVCFYATWCPHSKRWLEKYLRAAEESRWKRKVVFALVDAEKNDVVTKNKIRLFPTVMLFRKGTNEEVVFTGRRSLPEFLRWLDEEVAREPKVEEPVAEVDETAKDYESPLKKKIKHDFEQRYTLEGLEKLPAAFEEGGKKGGDAKRRLQDAMGELERMMAERVLKKLNVDQLSIEDAIEHGKKAREWQEKKEEERRTMEDGKKNKEMERSTVEEKKRDTVEEGRSTVEDAIEHGKKAREWQEKKEEERSMEEKKGTVEGGKKGTVEEERGTVEEKEKSTVEEKKKDMFGEKKMKKETVEEKKKDTVVEKKKGIVEEGKKRDTVAEKEKSTVVEEKEKNTVVDEKEKDTVVDEKENDYPPKDNAPEPAPKKISVVEKPDSVETPKSTVVDDPKPTENTVDPKEAPKKKTVERHAPVKSEL